MLGLKLNHVSKSGPLWPNEDANPLSQPKVNCRQLDHQEHGLVRIESKHYIRFKKTCMFAKFRPFCSIRLFSSEVTWAAIRLLIAVFQVNINENINENITAGHYRTTGPLIVWRILSGFHAQRANTVKKCHDVIRRICFRLYARDPARPYLQPTFLDEIDTVFNGDEWAQIIVIMPNGHYKVTTCPRWDSGRR